MRRKVIVALPTVAVLALVAVLSAATPAAAATGKNGVVEPGEFGLYSLQNQQSWVLDLFVEDDNFADDVFPGTTISADNNTESYWNRDSFWWHVFTGAYYTGSHGCLPPNYTGNASATFKNTISSAYYSSSSC
jgi:Peptidase inhibitor family I36